MKKVYIFEHEDGTTAGTTTTWLSQNQIPYEVLRVSEITQYPALEDVQALIVCGGSMNVDEEKLHPWLMSEKIFIRDVVSRGIKYLGLCLGSQLLAETLGSPVGPLGQWEAGWHNIQTGTEKIPVFHWHRYTFETPAAAQRLAQSEVCKNQAFAYKNALGFQFHPEVDEKWIEETLESWTPEMKGAVQNPSDIRGLNEKNLSPMKTWYFNQLDNWWKQ